MGIENTGAGGVANPTPATKNPGDTISADTFNQMLDVLEQLSAHTHIFYDDYSTVCECQCACACNRGIL